MVYSNAKLSAAAAKKLGNIEQEIIKSKITDRQGDSFSRKSRPNSQMQMPFDKKRHSYAHYGQLEDFESAPVAANVTSPVGSVTKLIRANRNQMGLRTQTVSKIESPYQGINLQKTDLTTIKKLLEMNLDFDN
jgi:hypothetical protein